MFPKEKGLALLLKKNPFDASPPPTSGAFPKPANNEVLGLSSLLLFIPKLKPFVFGGENKGSSFLVVVSFAPKLKMLDLGASSTLDSPAGFGAKLKILAEVDTGALEAAVLPKENIGVVVVVVVPPLVTVQLGFLAKGDVVPPIGVLGFPKENVEVGFDGDDVLGTTAAGTPKLGSAGVVFVLFVLALSSSCSSFRCFS